MSPTKVLTINPEFFSSKGTHSKTMRKERKQKPTEAKTTNSMRKTLLAKIRDYQKKEGEKINENNKQTEENDPSFESEFNKSLNFLQQIANKHKDKKQKNKTFKRPTVRNQTEQNVNIELPEAFIDIPQTNINERNSTINTQKISNNQNQTSNYSNLNQNVNTYINTELTNVATHIQPTIDDAVNFKPLIKNNSTPTHSPSQILPIEPQSQTQSIQVSTETPIQITETILPPHETMINTEMHYSQKNNDENIKLEIKDENKVPELVEKVKSNVKTSVVPIRPKVSILNNHNITIKTPPPYSNLKGGNKPTYREWNKTYKTHTGQPRLSIDENKNMKMMIPCKKLITRKTKTIKYNLGKKGKNINILIKNNNTRKKIKQEIMSLRKKPIIEVKEYLHDKNLIKSGTLAPNDVLREIYEQSILSGDLINENKQNLIHNFLNTKPNSF